MELKARVVSLPAQSETCSLIHNGIESNCPVGALCYGGCRAMKYCPKDEILTYYVNTDLGKKVY